MHRLASFVAVTTILCFVIACGSDSPESLFPERAECEGASIAPLQGSQPMLISFLSVGTLEDGFDLDNDGEPDNKLAGVGSLANPAIGESFEDFDIVIPFEFFDVEDTLAADECVKFAIYIGAYKADGDGDGDDTAVDDGDCDDSNPDINKDATEVPGNGKDDDCDGLADETEEIVTTDAGEMVVQTPSDDTGDADGDGVTIADGDCDDTNMAVLGPASPEVCGDGFDNDCDGNADYADVDGTPACSPYDDTPDLISLDPLAFENGSPVVAFPAGTISGSGGAFALEAGPSIFSVGIPVSDDITLDLRISGATIEGDVSMTPAGWAISNGRLGGVIDGNTADKIRGLDVEQIGLTPEDSLLDATYANILGTLLGLPRVTINEIGCQTPDIDVDQDGLEAFCDSDPLDDVSKVDMCVDGNGEIIMDEKDSMGETITECSQALDSDGKPRFVDGISVELNFETVPTLLPATLP